MCFVHAWMPFLFNTPLIQRRHWHLNTHYSQAARAHTRTPGNTCMNTHRAAITAASFRINSSNNVPIKRPWQPETREYFSSRLCPGTRLFNYLPCLVGYASPRWPHLRPPPPPLLDAKPAKYGESRWRTVVARLLAGVSVEISQWTDGGVRERKKKEKERLGGKIRKGGLKIRCTWVLSNTDMCCMKK